MEYPYKMLNKQVFGYIEKRSTGLSPRQMRGDKPVLR